ncbi:hypothetical protein D3C76_1611230 [compost metagenome]
MLELIIYPEPVAQVLRIGNFVSSHNIGTKRCKGGERLAHGSLFLGDTRLNPHRGIDEAAVAEYVLHGFLTRNIACTSTDDHRKL